MLKIKRARKPLRSGYARISLVVKKELKDWLTKKGKESHRLINGEANYLLEKSMKEE